MGASIGQSPIGSIWSNWLKASLGYNSFSCSFIRWSTMVNDCAQRSDKNKTRMWANAQPDGRPAEHRWHPLFNAVGWIKMPLGTEVGLSPGDFVLHGNPAPLSKKGTQPPPQFSAHLHCGQMAGWIKVALRMLVGLGPGHIVLIGDPAPPLHSQI